ncbi:MAG: carboxypeptidase-like regulatory domain-containing protein, partial [Bacteroidetes bacterium]
MLSKILYCVLFMLGAQAGFATGIHGTVKNEAGEPLPFATIFIAETGSGTATNQDGYFEIRLAPGQYSVTFQFLGYRAETREIQLSEGDFVRMDVVLSEAAFDLKAVEIREGREDPAYTVMRRAIAKADFHRQQIERYTAKVYIKGSGRLLDSPDLLEKAMEENGIDSTTAFLVESVSEVTYQRPNTYTERVIHIRQQGEDNSTSPNQYLAGSFYDPEVMESVSPLSPRAFAYYRFEYLGSVYDQNRLVHRIKVTPRSPGEGVFEGTLSILDDLWSIYSLNLTTRKLGFEIRVSQIYAPVLEDVWLPVTHRFIVLARLFGFSFIYDYFATVSDYVVEKNPDLDVRFAVIDEKIDPVPPKNNRPEKGSLEEKTASGEPLTRKDLRKIMKAYQKEDRKKREAPNQIENHTLTVDSNAYNRDTALWEKLRPIPLTTYEIKAYKTADSLAAVVKNKPSKNDKTTTTKGKFFNITDPLFGARYDLGKRTTLILEGIGFHSMLTSAEGYALVGALKLRHKWDKGRQLTYGIQPRLAFARKKLIARGLADYQFGEGLRKGKWAVEGGRYVSEFNPEGTVLPALNNIYYLFGDNFIRLYEKKYLQTTFEKRLLDGLKIELRAEWARRNALPNATNHGIFNKDSKQFTPNTPENIELGAEPFPTHTALTLGASLRWQPWARYRVLNGEKSLLNDTPTLLFNFKKGLADVDYNFAEAGIRYARDPSDGSRTDVKILAGKFFRAQTLYLPDFRHFPGNQVLLAAFNPVESFRLLDYYRYSTGDWYMEAHLHHQFRKLMLTQFPAVWMVGLKENLFVNYLHTPAAGHYLEAGYGLDNILKIFRVEIAVGFLDFDYQQTGFRIGIS